MRVISSIKGYCTHAIGWALSVPIYLKIVGVGALVAILFGGITYVQTRRGMAQTLHENLARNAMSLSRFLATSLERPLLIGDLYSVNEELREIASAYPEIRYLIVRERSGELVAHTFENAVPEDLHSLPRERVSPDGELVVLGSDEGLVFDAMYPILGGTVGTLQLGLSDRLVVGQLLALRATIVWSLLLCCAVGFCLAAILAHILANPIDRLVGVVNSIRDGNLGARAKIHATDEIGALSRAFNQMAAALEHSRQEAEEKEQIRVALLERLGKSCSMQLTEHFHQSMIWKRPLSK